MGGRIGLAGRPGQRLFFNAGLKKQSLLPRLLCLHLHAVLGLKEGSLRGGHFLSGSVQPTMEVTITETVDHLRRERRTDLGTALISTKQRYRRATQELRVRDVSLFGTVGPFEYQELLWRPKLSWT